MLLMNLPELMANNIYMCTKKLLFKSVFLILFGSYKIRSMTDSEIPASAINFTADEKLTLYAKLIAIFTTFSESLFILGDITILK